MHDDIDGNSLEIHGPKQGWVLTWISQIVCMIHTHISHRIIKTGVWPLTRRWALTRENMVLTPNDIKQVKPCPQ